MQQFKQCASSEQQEQFVRSMFAQRGVDLEAFARLNNIQI